MHVKLEFINTCEELTLLKFKANLSLKLGLHVLLKLQCLHYNITSVRFSH